MASYAVTTAEQEIETPAGRRFLLQNTDGTNDLIFSTSQEDDLTTDGVLLGPGEKVEIQKGIGRIWVESDVTATAVIVPI